MAAAEKKKMVNGRVEESSAERASRVLKRHGLTMSEYVRNSVDYVARTGTVPESGLPASTLGKKPGSVRALLKRFEDAPMPGRADFEGVDADAMVDAIRLERYGY